MQTQPINEYVAILMATDDFGHYKAKSLVRRFFIGPDEPEVLKQARRALKAWKGSSRNYRLVVGLLTHEMKPHRDTQENL